MLLLGQAPRRKESEESLQRLNQDLLIATEKIKIAYNDIESFSYSASHDLRESLLIIDWYNNNILKIKDGKSLDTNVIEMLTIISIVLSVN